VSLRGLIGVISEWRLKRHERLCKQALILDEEQQILDRLGEAEIAANKKFLDRFEVKNERLQE
jgi:hypothetical protein